MSSKDALFVLGVSMRQAVEVAMGELVTAFVALTGARKGEYLRVKFPNGHETSAVAGGRIHAGDILTHTADGYVMAIRDLDNDDCTKNAALKNLVQEMAKAGKSDAEIIKAVFGE